MPPNYQNFHTSSCIQCYYDGHVEDTKLESFHFIFQRGPVVKTEETEMSISRMTVAMLCPAHAAELPSSRIAACGAPLARVGDL